MTTLQTLAVASVQERGFYDAAALPDLARNPWLSAQVLRITEECGELCAAVAAGMPPAKLAAEAADVAIVAYQIAHITGQRVRELRPGLGDTLLRPESLPLLALNIPSLCGELCRAIRKNRLHLIDVNLGLLWRALYCLTMAAGGGDLGDAILAKLDADNVRGYLHGDAAPVNPTGGDVQLSDLGEEHNVYTDGPIFTSRYVPERAINAHVWTMRRNA